MKKFFYPNDSEQDRVKLIDEIAQHLLNKRDSAIEITINAKRSKRQNRALHLYFKHISEALIDQGYTLDRFLKATKIEFTPTPVLVKELLYRPIQKKITGIYSTKDLSRTHMIELIVDSLTKALATIGIYVPFPNKEELNAKENNITT